MTADFQQKCSALLLGPSKYRTIHFILTGRDSREGQQIDTLAGLTCKSWSLTVCALIKPTEGFCSRRPQSIIHVSASHLLHPRGFCPWYVCKDLDRYVSTVVHESPLSSNALARSTSEKVCHSFQVDRLSGCGCCTFHS